MTASSSTSARSSTRLSSARQTARVAALYLRDRLLRPVASTLDEVPPFAHAITDDWLTLALCGDTGARVASSRYETVSDGSTGRSRFHLRYDGPAEAVASLPATVFVKHTSTFTTRLQVGASGGASGEVRFYQQIEPDLPVPTPHGYFGSVDRRSGRSILLIEDMTRTRDIEFGDCRSPLTRGQAEGLVDTMAGVHGTFLDSPRFSGDLRWLTTAERLQQGLNTYVAYEQRCLVGLERAGDLLPTSVRDHAHELHGLLMRSFAMDRHRPLGLVHTDTHAGNWFRATDDSMGLFDWSAYSRGNGTRDLVYAMMSALTTEDRRAWERDLVARYAERLSSISGVPHDAEDVWTSYRQQALHGFSFWTYTLGAGRLQPAMQEEEVSRLNLTRMAQAVEDLDTVRALADVGEDGRS